MSISDHGNLNLQNKISDALDANLQRIEELKSLIASMEQSNAELAGANDEFRAGAMDAVQLARQVEDLQRDKHVQLNDLSGKTGVIKKLLHDNHVLSKQIETARVDAKARMR